ncbi:hypothetical protein, partial [Mycobacterium alsense]|uniref:hypothetical protein n=1 Tax=Mycobacterium alsense TaxID=324058 RepID=UPI001A95A5A0
MDVLVVAAVGEGLSFVCASAAMSTTATMIATTTVATRIATGHALVLWGSAIGGGGGMTGGLGCVVGVGVGAGAERVRAHGAVLRVVLAVVES